MAAQDYYNGFSQQAPPAPSQTPGHPPPQYQPWEPTQPPTSAPVVQYNPQDNKPPYPVDDVEQGYQRSPGHQPQQQYQPQPQPQHYPLQHHHSYAYPQSGLQQPYVQQPYPQPNFQQTPYRQQGQQEYSNDHLLPPLSHHRSYSEPPQHHHRHKSAERSRSRHDRKHYSRPRSRSRHRSRSRSHSRSRAPHRKEREHSSRNTFLGALSGGVIGDLIFPGLGTIGGAVLGGVGGHKASRSSSGQPRRRHDKYEEEYEEGKRRRGEI